MTEKRLSRRSFLQAAAGGLIAIHHPELLYAGFTSDSQIPQDAAVQQPEIAQVSDHMLIDTARAVLKAKNVQLVKPAPVGVAPYARHYFELGEDMLEVTLTGIQHDPEFGKFQELSIDYMVEGDRYRGANFFADSRSSTVRGYNKFACTVNYPIVTGQPGKYTDADDISTEILDEKTSEIMSTALLESQTRGKASDFDRITVRPWFDRITAGHAFEAATFNTEAGDVLDLFSDEDGFLPDDGDRIDFAAKRSFGIIDVVNKAVPLAEMILDKIGDEPELPELSSSDFPTLEATEPISLQQSEVLSLPEMPQVLFEQDKK